MRLTFSSGVFSVPIGTGTSTGNHRGHRSGCAKCHASLFPFAPRPRCVSTRIGKMERLAQFSHRPLAAFLEQGIRRAQTHAKHDVTSEPFGASRLDSERVGACACVGVCACRRPDLRFAALPADVLRLIFVRLPRRSRLLGAGLVCRRWMAFGRELETHLNLCVRLRHAVPRIRRVSIPRPCSHPSVKPYVLTLFRTVIGSPGKTSCRRVRGHPRLPPMAASGSSRTRTPFGRLSSQRRRMRSYSPFGSHNPP